jgi:hypothetical protein
VKKGDVSIPGYKQESSFILDDRVENEKRVFVMIARLGFLF